MNFTSLSRFTLIEKNISSNQLFSNFFSNNVGFTKFLPKKCESMYVNFYDTILHCEPISIFHCKEQNKKICVKIVSTYCLMVNFGRTECL